MKKLLLAGFLSFAALGMASAPASAWPLLERLGGLHCCGKCTSVICCRQYNAFTPVCFGSITCIGCSPVSACGGGMPMCSPQGGGYPPVPYCGPSCDAGACSASDCCSGGTLPAPGSYGTPAPNTFIPPMPNPVATTSQMYPAMGRAMVQPVSYQTGYYPAPYYGYRPVMMAPMYPMQGAYRPMYPQQPMGGSFPNAFFGGN